MFSETVILIMCKRINNQFISLIIIFAEVPIAGHPAAVAAGESGIIEVRIGEGNPPGVAARLAILPSEPAAADQPSAHPEPADEPAGTSSLIPAPADSSQGSAAHAAHAPAAADGKLPHFSYYSISC